MQSPEAFIEDYTSAWRLPADVEKIAEFYNSPSLTLRGDASFVALRTQSEVRRYFQFIAETYERSGIAQPSFKDLTSHRIGSRALW